jgi:hypothetical protein
MTVRGAKEPGKWGRGRFFLAPEQPILRGHGRGVFSFAPRRRPPPGPGLGKGEFLASRNSKAPSLSGRVRVPGRREIPGGDAARVVRTIRGIVRWLGRAPTSVIARERSDRGNLPGWGGARRLPQTRLRHRTRFRPSRRAAVPVRSLQLQRHTRSLWPKYARAAVATLPLAHVAIARGEPLRRLFSAKRPSGAGWLTAALYAEP